MVLHNQVQELQPLGFGKAMLNTMIVRLCFVLLGSHAELFELLA